MSEEEKNEMELNIEAKYVGRTEKEFLNNITFAECLYILDTKNNYCDEIKGLSLLKLVDIISKLQADIEIKDKENKAITYNFEKTVDKLEIAYKVINLMAEQLTTPVHSKEWVIKYFEDEIK